MSFMSMLKTLYPKKGSLLDWRLLKIIKDILVLLFKWFYQHQNDVQVSGLTKVWLARQNIRLCQTKCLTAFKKFDKSVEKSDYYYVAVLEVFPFLLPLSIFLKIMSAAAPYILVVVKQVRPIKWWFFFIFEFYMCFMYFCIMFCFQF